MITLRAILVPAAVGEQQPAGAVDLSVAAGELVAIVGPNGSGKTSLLRIIAGLDRPVAGSCACDESVRIGMVVQDPVAQFVAATVEEEVAFGVESIASSRAEVRARVAGALDSFALRDLAGRNPRQLSGGQQQRVAIASALACDARLLLLDEPCSQLDAAQRTAFRDLVLEVNRRGCTVIWVTQQPDDVVCCQRVVALHAGSIAFDGTPRELYDDASWVHRLGIAEPAAVRIARALRSHGVSLPQLSLTVDELGAQV